MKQNILAIDDEPHMLRLLERIVTEKTAYDIVTVNNSLEVEEILQQQQFDLIITDLKMPGKDGLDILRMVQEMERDEEVIIITAFASLDSAMKALSMGVFDYITKPFKREQIIHTINRAMRWQKFRHEALYWEGVVATEPYADARRMFEEEYIRRLAQRFNSDVRRMAEASGIKPGRIREVIEHG